jgi:amino acid adenylation domain-containing protein
MSSHFEDSPSAPLGEEALRYWREQLAGAPPLLTLPADRPSSAVRRELVAGESLALPPDIGIALRAVGRAEGATLFMTLVGAYAVLLGRYTGQTDVVVGAPFAANLLPVRIPLSGRPSFRELLRRVREVVLDIQAHQELSFTTIVEELRPPGSLQRHPVFQVLFQLVSERPEEPRLTATPSSAARVSFDLSLLVEEQTDQALRCHCAYAADRFGGETIRHLLRHYRMLLEQVAAAPDQPIDIHSLVAPEGEAPLPDPRAALPAKPHPLVFDAVAARARSAPDALAVVQGERRWTYAELMTAVGNLTQALEAAGVAQGDFVALTGEPSFGLVASMLGILRRGGVMVPLDPILPEGRRRVMFEQVAPRASVLVDQPALVGQSAPATLQVDPNTGGVLASDVTSPGGNGQSGAPGPDDPAYVFFTSGTTGVPKGVLGVHHALAHFLAWEAETLNVQPADRVALFSSISFDVILRDTFLPLTTGATLVLPPANLGPDRSLGWLADAEISIIHVTPSRARLWADTAGQGITAPSLRWVCFSGEALTDVVVRRWRALTSPRCRFVNLYGPTEATMVRCFHLLPENAEMVPGVQPVGRPMSETQILVLAEGDRLCGVGEVGELTVRTPHLTLGYLNAPGEQAARFAPNPFRSEAADRIYRTGDLGRYRADGTLVWLGRRDDQLKINGFRLEPDEVTATLARHPAVRACTVIGYQGDSGTALAAFVVRESDVEARDLRAYLGDRVLAVMVPGSFTFVPRLPLTNTGKIDRQALLALRRESDGQEETADTSPVGPLEEALATIWCEVLGLERLGRSEDVFTRGAQSLVIMRVIARIRARFGLTLTPRAIFEASTVAELAHTLGCALAERLAALEPADESA